MIVVTGAAGFIGSRMVHFLNARGIPAILAIDRNTQWSASHYLDDVKCIRSNVGSQQHLDYNISAVIHIGAISDTLETDWNKFNRFNILNTMYWRDFTKLRNIPFVWASSSAIYGNGAGPLNQYAISKLLSEVHCADHVVALRFHNVYGPHEQHKGRMASVIYNWYNQYKNQGHIKVFENSAEYHRDLIHVDDVCGIVWHMINNYQPGVYDVGTGTSQNMADIAKSLLTHLNADTAALIKIPMPDDLKLQYQYNTCANLDKLISAGFNSSDIRPLSVGMPDYINYLQSL